MAEGPLAGILVVALEQAVAVPFCTSRLADAGARVIKVERPEGDFARRYDRAAAGQSSYFVWLNRGKESIALDLKDAGDRRLLLVMIDAADVFIQNLAPGAIDRLGLSNEELERRNPRLVQVNVSGYGTDGPYADRKAYDLLVQADSGLASVTGNGGPARVGVSVCDIATGMYAGAAILEALIERATTGEGCIVDVSMFDAMADWMSVPLLQAEASGCSPPRMGLHHASIAPYGAFPCADGIDVLVAVQNEREWRRFCTDLLGDAAMAGDPRFADMVARVENRPALHERIAAVFARLGSNEVMERCATARIAYARVNDALSLAAHPHLRRSPVRSEGGESRPAAPPAVRRGRRKLILRAVPALDEHGDRLRAEFAPRPAMTSLGKG